MNDFLKLEICVFFNIFDVFESIESIIAICTLSSLASESIFLLASKSFDPILNKKKTISASFPEPWLLRGMSGCSVLTAVVAASAVESKL